VAPIADVRPIVNLPSEHPERRALADEVHARPPQPLQTPCRATYLALLVDADDRVREHAQVVRLCEHFGVSPPKPGATHFRADFGTLRLKWERHGEFSGFTFFADGLSPQPFSAPPATLLPHGWLSALPGLTVVAAHAKLIAAGDGPLDVALLGAHFDGNIVVGSAVGGAGEAYTDYRIHADGCSRFVLVDRGFTPRQAGRMLQRLFEIEAYRMMALLALPMARRQSVRIAEIERALAALTDDIAGGGGQDEALLQSLTRLAAEVESGLAASQFRFGACRAYFELVSTRIAELREQRLPGLQTIEEFMSRRFTPAVATCNSTAARMHQLSERVAQASALLSTRVDIARERQNQALLASMDRRAKLQLRLQQTVEGLSVAAIVYYVAGLVGYLAKGLKASGLLLDIDLVVGVSVPLLAVVVLLAVRRARRRIGKAEPDL
jgi:uncharacterized membrane-anchored protein